MVNIQKSLNREMILSGQGVNSQPRGGGRGGAQGRPGRDTERGKSDSKVTSICTHLEKALLLNLIMEHDMATSESCESGESRPAPSA